jgi:hypothetical protein
LGRANKQKGSLAKEASVWVSPNPPRRTGQIVVQLPQASVPQLGMSTQPVDNKAQPRYSLASKMLE